MYIFDTDHLGVLQRQSGNGFENLVSRLAEIDQSSFYTTIISFHEQINGWTKYIKNSTQVEKTVTGYWRLESILNDFSRAQVLPFQPTLLKFLANSARRKLESRRWTCVLRLSRLPIK